MTCEDCKNMISAFLDAELENQTNIEVAQHLEKCDTCQNLYQAEKRVKELLQSSYHSEKAPFELRATIRNQLAGKRKRAGLFNLISPRPLPFFASVLAVVILVFISIRFFGTQSSSIDLSKVEMSGRIECISCYLSQTEHVDNYCDHYGHELGFVSESKEIYSFYPNALSQQLKSKLEYIHTDVKLTGWVFHQANFIELENYHIIGRAVAANLPGIKIRF